MSALGQKQTSDCRLLMSAIPPKADIGERDPDVRFVPADIRREAVLHDHTAGNTRATAAQRRRLVGVIITARVDHDRAAFNVAHGEVWCCNGLRSFTAGINGKHWHIALVALTLWPEMFASVSGVVMASRRHPSCWLAVRSAAGTAIRINVDMKTVVARRQLGKLWRDSQSFIGIR